MSLGIAVGLNIDAEQPTVAGEASVIGVFGLWQVTSPCSRAAVPSVDAI